MCLSLFFYVKSLYQPENVNMCRNRNTISIKWLSRTLIPFTLCVRQMCQDWFRQRPGLLYRPRLDPPLPSLHYPPSLRAPSLSLLKTTGRSVVQKSSIGRDYPSFALMKLTLGVFFFFVPRWRDTPELNKWRDRWSRGTDGEEQMAAGVLCSNVRG